MSIPGQGEVAAASTQLEHDLFLILCVQHERVNLFTRSKYGEFERRMDYIDRQARLLTRQQNDQSSQPIQNTRRYAKLVQEANGVGEDIQSLSRYVTTQKQAFRKILKKYRKWTGSPGLELRMNNEVYNEPGSVLNLDFIFLLDHLAGVNSTLAALSESGGNAGEQSLRHHARGSAAPPPKPKSIASRLHDEFLHSAPLDFDAAFTAIPLGMAGGRASYWIHKDNLEEVTVLLRRYMKGRKGSTPPSLSRRTSITFSPAARRDSAHSGMSEARTHISMFDNLQRFIKAHGAVTVGQAEDLVASVASKLAMSILWTSEAGAVIITSDLSPSAAPTQRHMDIAHMKAKNLVRLFEPQPRPPSRFSTGSNHEPSASDASLQIHRDWLAQNRDIKPLAEVQCTRSRFAGLNNTNDVGTWALMDMDITMSSIDQSTIGNEYSGGDGNVQSFPHTVLEVRWEFSRTPEIVRALDSTHLVERIRGFSMEAQAISTVCKPLDMPSPLWQPLLERDIRKVPPLETRTSSRKNTSKVASSRPSSTDGPSTSAFSAGALISSATSIQESGTSTPPATPLISKQEATRMLHPPNKKASRRKSRSTQQLLPRYWNEFDDGDEVPEDQVYAIYVHPDEQTAFPGAETVSKAFSAMYQSLGRTKRRVVSWLPMQFHGHDRDHDAEEGVRRPLLGVRSRDVDDDNDDSSDTEPSIPCAKFSKKRCSTGHPSTSDIRRTSLPQSHHTFKRQPVRSSHENALYRTYVGCYAISIILLIMSAIMKASGRHKAKVQVDAGIIVGVIAALASAIVAVSLMVSREERLSWLHRGLGSTAFLVVCVGSGWLLAVVGGSLSE